MTEGKIKRLQSLLQTREQLRNEIEKFDEIFKLPEGELYFDICLQRSPRNTVLHIIKDHGGKIMGALKRIYETFKADLAEVQKEIDNM